MRRSATSGPPAAMITLDAVSVRNGSCTSIRPRLRLRPQRPRRRVSIDAAELREAAAQRVDDALPAAVEVVDAEEARPHLIDRRAGIEDVAARSCRWSCGRATRRTAPPAPVCRRASRRRCARRAPSVSIRGSLGEERQQPHPVAERRAVASASGRRAFSDMRRQRAVAQHPHADRCRATTAGARPRAARAGVAGARHGRARAGRCCSGSRRARSTGRARPARCASRTRMRCPASAAVDAGGEPGDPGPDDDDVPVIVRLGSPASVRSVFVHLVQPPWHRRSRVARES